MENNRLKDLPFMLYADKKGRIYDHPHYRMAGMSGTNLVVPHTDELTSLSEFSKLFYIPGCPPIGLDPDTGTYEIVEGIEVDGRLTPCYAVAAFLEPGEVRALLPAVDYRPKSYVLPMWAYASVGFRDEGYWASGFRVEYNRRWDPSNYDDRLLVPAIKRYQKKGGDSPLVSHLVRCATENHCFAAKNLFLIRWEAPLPVSQKCNAGCLGCLSLQPGSSCAASHQRINFRPSKKEIVSLAVSHLNHAPDAIVSFGQGCEGEPLTESRLIADSITEIRRHTDKGTINLNTNGSLPDEVGRIVESGLDSIRISLNSAREAFYRAYYRPKNYGFEQVVDSISLAKKMGAFTMLNYLVFPGVTDQEEEIRAMVKLIRETGVDFVHLKNLCIDPPLYLEKMPKTGSVGVGMKKMMSILKQERPHLELGYFNQAV